MLDSTRLRFKAIIKGLTLESNKLRREKQALVGRIYTLVGQDKRGFDVLKRTGEFAEHVLDTSKRYEYAQRAQLTRKELGIDARHTLLAYGFLKGYSYTQMEARCRKGNEPSPFHIKRIIEMFGTHADKTIWTLEKIKATLTPGGAPSTTPDIATLPMVMRVTR